MKIQRNMVRRLVHTSDNRLYHLSNCISSQTLPVVHVASCVVMQRLKSVTKCIDPRWCKVNLFIWLVLLQQIQQHMYHEGFQGIHSIVSADQTTAPYKDKHYKEINHRSEKSLICMYIGSICNTYSVCTHPPSPSLQQIRQTYIHTYIHTQAHNQTNGSFPNSVSVLGLQGWSI